MKRFEVIYKEGSIFSKMGKKEILLDTETGVQYLGIYDGMTHAITPLLDKDGLPYRKDVSSKDLQ